MVFSPGVAVLPAVHSGPVRHVDEAGLPAHEHDDAAPVRHVRREVERLPQQHRGLVQVYDAHVHSEETEYGVNGRNIFTTYFYLDP